MRFTVITPTYNRARLLPGVFASLCAQTFQDFEWIIVDDGSDDGTAQLVSSWQAFFPIRYSPQIHGGLHRALNRGVALAQGEWVTQLDDDDRIVPQALECFDRELQSIAADCANVVALCCNEDGSFVGDPFPSERLDAIGVGKTLAINGPVDRWGIMRADVARAFPFPDFSGEDFIVPGVVYNRIHARYPTRYFNQALKVVSYAPGHMSSADLRWANPKGAVLYNAELAFSDAYLGTRSKAAINACRFSLVVALHWVTHVPTANKLWSSPRGAALYYRELVFARGLSPRERLSSLAAAFRFSLIAGVKRLIGG